MNHFVHCCSFSTSNKNRPTPKGCQSASQTCDFDAKNAKILWGGGTPPPQTPIPVGRGTPPLHNPPPRRLDLNPSYSEILPTLLAKITIVATVVQRGGACRVEPQPAQAPPRCTKCNSPPINGQYVPITVLLYNGRLFCGFNVS